MEWSSLLGYLLVFAVGYSAGSAVAYREMLGVAKWLRRTILESKKKTGAVEEIVITIR